jgi:hypothetical protein
MRKLVVFAGLALVATCASAADNGIYLGAAVSADATLDGAQYRSDLSLKDRPYKLILGIRPLDYFGVEVNYLDFGTAKRSDIPDAFYDLKARFYDAFAVGYLPLPLVDLYAKAGLVRWDTDVRASTIAGPLLNLSDSGTDFAYGAGAQVRFGSLAARLEYERFEVSNTNRVDLLSLGVTWTFL